MNPLNELEIAEKLISGELSGAVTNGDYFYIPLRLTGTGLAERTDSEGKSRILDRKMEVFSTPELMEQYSNIPVALDHPKDAEGNSVRVGVKYGEIVGNTIKAYIRDDLKEIWVIARMHDAETIKAIMGYDLSTSPHFISEEEEQENSEILLEIPKGINSLAIVNAGFWDKKSDSPSIDNSGVNLIKEGIMETEKIDSVLTGEASSEKVDETPKDDTTKKQDETKECKADSDPEEDKADGEVEEEVAEIKEAEAKEGEAFEKLAEDHKKLDKEDSMEEKKEEIIEKKDEAPKEEIKEEVKEEIKADSEMISGDEYTDDDKEREEILKVVTDIVDSADSELGVKRIFIGTDRLKPSVVIKRFAKANSGFVSAKYAGMIDKVDSSTLEIGKDIIADIKANIAKKASESEKVDTASSVVTHADGSRSFKI